MSQSLKIAKAQAYLKSKAFLLHGLQVIVGSLFLAVISLAKVPLYPTPMTLQTLGVFMIGLALGSKRGAMAVFLYLLEATCGWPVLSGGISNPLWMIGPNAGFLWGFLPATFVIGYLMETFRKKTFVKALFSVICGQVCIYIMGVSWLACFFGFKKAIAVGVVPFLATMPIKVFLATIAYKPMLWVKQKF